MKLAVLLTIAGVTFGQGLIPAPIIGVSGGGGGTIASTTNILQGDGAGNADSSGIAAANVVTQSANGTSGGVCGYTSANKSCVSSISGVAGAMMAWGGAGATPTSPLSLLVTNQNSATETFTFYNSTASTGNTKVVIRSGAGDDSSCPFVYQFSNGSAAFNICNNAATAGYVATNQPVYIGSLTRFNAGIKLNDSGNGSIWMASGATVAFTSSVADGTKDTGISRCAAGIVCIGTGTQGSKAGRLALDNSTPSAASDACTAQSIWADANYFYACTSSGAIKRVAIASW